MFLQVPEQVREEFAECSTPAGCVQTRPKPLVTFRPIKTQRGNAVVSRELGSNVRRIVKFPHRTKPDKASA